ncbi:ComEA family DNA-binding protein [Bordetella genomosp. 1]|uniref:Competence protein ComE n=1 Tax=Bordetella genomosp. 1 TaxID=1395607 RepID=A0ABX4F0Y0_9BORD|nr:helix-hairpin-helix domain-containing protein [Bordetella genomosp. 1]OZI65666.1 hypothetical protein CAL27_11630 [Bordetella genomosp. 1]
MSLSSFISMMPRAVRHGRGLLAALTLLSGLVLPGGDAHAIDVNRADAQQLQTVRGIGPQMAGRIVTERDRNGPFASLEALRERVRGIGEKKLQALRDAGLSAGAAGGAGVGGAPGRAGQGAAPARGVRSHSVAPPAH